MRMFLLAVLAILFLPTGAAQAPIPAVENLQVEPGNQILRIRWDALGDPAVAGYYVYVYSDRGLIQQINTPDAAATYYGAVNDRTYTVQIAAHDASGAPGALSAPVGATPTLRHDQTYLAVGLMIVWLGIWIYAMLLTRAERDLSARVERLESARKTPRGNT